MFQLFNDQDERNVLSNVVLTTYWPMLEVLLLFYNINSATNVCWTETCHVWDVPSGVRQGCAYEHLYETTGGSTVHFLAFCYGLSIG